jgi:hypothetical protein
MTQYNTMAPPPMNGRFAAGFMGRGGDNAFDLPFQVNLDSHKQQVRCATIHLRHKVKPRLGYTHAVKSFCYRWDVLLE